MTCNNITGVLGSFYSKQVFNFVWGKDIETQKSFAARNRLFTFTEFPNVGFTEFPKIGQFPGLSFTFIVAPKESVNCEDSFNLSNLHNSNSQLLGRALW